MFAVEPKGSFGDSGFAPRSCFFRKLPFMGLSGPDLWHVISVSGSSSIARMMRGGLAALRPQGPRKLAQWS